MSSKYSVINFSKDQTTLQGAADALTGYLFIGTIWTIGSVFINYGQYGWSGLVASLAANFVIMGWIILSYIQAFKISVKRYGLKFPKILRLNFD